MYMSRLEVEGESSTICLIYYSPSLNIAHAIAQKLCDGFTQAGKPSKLMSSHGTSCLPQWGPCPASWPCHSPACRSSWKWGPAFPTILRISSHGFAFPSWNKNILRYFGVYWKPLELLGTKAACYLSPAQMSGWVHYKLPTPLIEILVRKRGWKGAQAAPPKTIHRLAAPSVHYL